VGAYNKYVNESDDGSSESNIFGNDSNLESKKKPIESVEVVKKVDDSSSDEEEE
jgi:hypothetical protein